MTPRLLHEWVTEQANRRPDAVAVVSGTNRVTYGELDAVSNKVARVLREWGCGRGDRVALLMPKAPMAIASLLGIYKADAIYVPVDPGSPASRIQKIVASCGPRLVLAAGPVAPTLQQLCPGGPLPFRIGWLGGNPPDAHCLEVDFTLDDIAASSAAPLDGRNASDDPAHILFTSGSTGTPKGVVITHGSVVHFVRWAVSYFGLNASDRLSAHAPLHFDLSFFDIFGAAAAGAELHLVPAELNVLPNKLADFMRASALTQWFSVPSVLAYLARFDVIRQGDFPRLRRLLWAGEVLPTPTLIQWMRRLPHVRFSNLYGPTETTIASSC
jgi:non-ribosomal peptide synthetase component F